MIVDGSRPERLHLPFMASIELLQYVVFQPAQWAEVDLPFPASAMLVQESAPRLTRSPIARSDGRTTWPIYGSGKFAEMP